jgi:hypothetical protein
LRPERSSLLSSAQAEDRLRLALELRDDWLQAGLSTLPADRGAAEAAVAGLYRLADEPEPRFEWVPSPLAGLRLIRDRPVLPPGWQRAATAFPLGRDWPVTGQLAFLQSRLRERIAVQVGRRRGELWTERPGVVAAHRVSAQEALASGVSLADVVEVTVLNSLTWTLRDTVSAPLRAELTQVVGPLPAPGWYGQGEAYWSAYYDICQRTGLARYRPEDARQLRLWATLARSAGWWWPDRGVCVLADRPAAVHTEPLPGGLHGQLRLHHADGPAVRYTDGFGLHVLHGTPVPAWVLTNPSVQRITAEPNVEVRRSAIERIGWDAYIRLGGLTLVAASPDPGNPGAYLRLYDLPGPSGGTPGRVLLAVNGTPEPDGQRRQYGLRIPPVIDNPVEAAGWTYGLSGEQYARLARRT